ncbi:cytochrome c biogenesis protein DipZ [Ewingella americana]|uniref:DipZ family protein n=2 Tax=Ewingella americana TaxID=41202 RepID=A0A085G6R5_EWIA3|nr:cytochrome c biogenesis protein DipZ [Ewingella americana]KAA8727558.1 cytochrome c biogenesis protein DipZ [Ewingella americana]KFC79410.1 DipZ family protein [Ewingella americana ATCC 33852]STQ42832.1 thiol-disulfide oxidoreductase [Ewingella americana]
MPILIAYLGGMLTLLSPCTLPVIPLLFAGAGSNKRHFAALLVGMVLTFTLVALLATASSEWVVHASKYGRWLALGLLAITALSLISERFAQKIAQPAVRLGSLLDSRSRQQRGITSALLAGGAVGLLWAPCAGPILGAILSTTMLNGASGQSGLLLLAYGSGCATMLALLWFCGDKLLTRLRAKMALTLRFRQMAGVMMLASVVFIASGATSLLDTNSAVGQQLEQHLLTLKPSPAKRVILQPVDIQAPSSQMPSLNGAITWLNSPALTPEQLKGKVVLIDFWTFDCINCQHSIPYVREWAEKYQSQGLVVIGIHTPEYPWEKNIDAVKQALNKWNIKYPVAVDNNYAIWNAFGNQYWPAHYYFDAKGQLRYQNFGEGNYQQQEKVINALLAEAKA